MTADAAAVESEDERAGAKAEQLVVERVRAALPPDYRPYPNVRWIGRTADHRGLWSGEADLVIERRWGDREARLPDRGT